MIIIACCIASTFTLLDPLSFKFEDGSIVILNYFDKRHIIEFNWLLGRHDMDKRH